MKKYFSRKLSSFTPTPKNLVGGFTLIELLVATTLFAIIVAISMVILTSIFNSLSKANAFGSVQESSRKAMEMIANDVKRADLTQEQGGFYGFEIASYNLSDPVSQPNGQYTGPALKVFKPGDTRKVYKLKERNTSGGYDDISGDVSQCPASATCALMMLDVDATGAIRETPISSPNVNVEKLTFSGYHKTTAALANQPYVTIEMQVQSRWQQKTAESETMNLRTTAITYEYNRTGENPGGGGLGEIVGWFYGRPPSVQIYCPTKPDPSNPGALLYSVAIGSGHWADPLYADGDFNSPMLMCQYLPSGVSVSSTDIKTWNPGWDPSDPNYPINGCPTGNAGGSYLARPGDYVITIGGHGRSCSGGGECWDDQEFSYARFVSLIGARIDYNQITSHSYYLNSAGICEPGHVMIGVGHTSNPDSGGNCRDRESEIIICAKLVTPSGGNWEFE